MFVSGVLIEPCSKCSIDLFLDEPDTDCESDTETVVPSKQKKTLTEEQIKRKKENRDKEMKHRAEKMAMFKKKREDDNLAVLNLKWKSREHTILSHIESRLNSVATFNKYCINQPEHLTEFNR